MCKKNVAVALMVAVMAFVVSGIAEAITIRLAGQDPPEHISTRSMMRLKKIVEEKTNGEVEIKTFPTNQLGDYIQVYEEVARGTIDMAIISIPSQFDQRQEIYFTPYMATKWSEVENLYGHNKWMFKQIEGFHKEMDVKLLGLLMDGFIGLGLTKEPKAPLDPTVNKEVLVRIPNMEMNKLAVEALGYSTVSIPYADVYTALQTGVAEGWYGGAASHSYLGFRDVLKHYYVTNTYADIMHWIVAPKVWDSLTEEQQKIIQDAIIEIDSDAIKEGEEEENHYLKLLEESGIKVHRYTDEELRPLVEHVRKTVWPHLDKLLNKELADGIRENFGKN